MRRNITTSRSVSLVVFAVVAALACASGAMAHDHSSGGLVARQQHQNIHQHHKFVLKARQTAAAAGDGDGSGDSDSGDQSAQQASRGGAAASSSASSSSSSSSSSRTFLATSTPPASASSNTQVASQTSQPGGNLISNIGDGLSSALNIPSSSSSVLSQPTTASQSSSQSSAPANSVNVPASSPSSNPAAQQSVAADTDSVENVTLYSTVSAPTTSGSLDEAAASASAAAAAEAAKKKENESSGLGKSTIIIIVVVASCIGGAIAIWTIIRKIKLSPSSRFDRKLAPIDFDAGRRDSDIYGTAAGNFATIGSTSSLGHAHSSNNIAGADAWPVHRSPSMSSEGHGYSNGGLSRQPSSGAGVMLNSRSGSPEGKSDLGHNPAMSEIGYNAFYPSLPPTSHNHNNIYGAPRDGYGAAPTSDYYNPGVGYSGSTRRPNY